MSVKNEQLKRQNNNLTINKTFLPYNFSEQLINVCLKLKALTNAITNKNKQNMYTRLQKLYTRQFTGNKVEKPQGESRPKTTSPFCLLQWFLWTDSLFDHQRNQNNAVCAQCNVITILTFRNKTENKKQTKKSVAKCEMNKCLSQITDEQNSGS